MLSRSSLETQKLELMSAMSELKLQQAALERENIELRASQLNNNVHMMPPRRPPVPARSLTTGCVGVGIGLGGGIGNASNGTSAGGVPNNGMHGSHGSLQQTSSSSLSATAAAAVNSSGTPKVISELYAGKFVWVIVMWVE